MSKHRDARSVAVEAGAAPAAAFPAADPAPAGEEDEERGELGGGGEQGAERERAA